MSKGLKVATTTPPSETELTYYYKGRIDALNLDRVSVNRAYLTENNIVIIEIHGGFNGHGTWNEYCDQIKTIVRALPCACVASLDTDILDDVWYLQINCKNQLY